MPFSSEKEWEIRLDKWFKMREEKGDFSFRLQALDKSENHFIKIQAHLFLVEDYLNAEKVSGNALVVHGFGKETVLDFVKLVYANLRNATFARLFNLQNFCAQYGTEMAKGKVWGLVEKLVESEALGTFEDDDWNNFVNAARNSDNARVKSAEEMLNKNLKDAVLRQLRQLFEESSDSVEYPGFKTPESSKSANLTIVKAQQSKQNASRKPTRRTNIRGKGIKAASKSDANLPLCTPMAKVSHKTNSKSKKVNKVSPRPTVPVKPSLSSSHGSLNYTSQRNEAIANNTQPGTPGRETYSLVSVSTSLFSTGEAMQGVVANVRAKNTTMTSTGWNVAQVAGNFTNCRAPVNYQQGLVPFSNGIPYVTPQAAWNGGYQNVYNSNWNYGTLPPQAWNGANAVSVSVQLPVNNGNSNIIFQQVPTAPNANPYS